MFICMNVCVCAHMCKHKIVENLYPPGAYIIVGGEDNKQNK